MANHGGKDLQRYREVWAKKENVKDAERALEEAVKSNFKIGQSVHFIRRGVVQKGEVTQHGYKGELWVRNLRTGSTTKVTPHYLVEYLEYVDKLKGYA